MILLASWKSTQMWTSETKQNPVWIFRGFFPLSKAKAKLMTWSSVELIPGLNQNNFSHSEIWNELKNALVWLSISYRLVEINEKIQAGGQSNLFTQCKKPEAQTKEYVVTKLKASCICLWKSLGECLPVVEALCTGSSICTIHISYAPFF